MSKQSRLADGTYSATITVPGYHAQTVSVQVVNPTDCGCCTCCPFFTNTQVSLEPDGTPITGCCSDLVTDPNNCGVCGKKCATDAWCASGACTPVYSPCVRSSDGFSTCSDYCKKQGTTCKSACGPSGGEAIHWWGQGSVNCGDNIYSSHGTCDDPLTMYTGVRCCCS